MSTLLFLHGALSSSSQFDSIMDIMRKTSVCAALDFPLHGQNQLCSSLTIPHFADYLIQTIEEKYEGKVSVFGYSMGGYAAMYAAV
ncbi:hypothetical protein EMGBS15_15530 [Filimonas sp.]|nr:hypothetical protein EMGBS15_15530 [Filimonas sp.]